jgi:transposase
MEDNKSALEGARLLYRTIMLGNHYNNKPYSDESDELLDFLGRSAYLTLDVLTDLGDDKYSSDNRKNITHIRYLAALLFDKDTVYELAKTIHYILDNDNLTISDIQDILYGSSRDIDIKKIQRIGKLLYEGKSYRYVSSEVGVSYDTIERIESFTGINQARKDRLIDQACDAVREGVSVRTFAKQVNIPKSTAHTVMNKAKSVLRELGEIE